MDGENTKLTFDMIMEAGEPGDRWFALGVGRDPSVPDGTSGQAGGKSGHRGFRS